MKSMAVARRSAADFGKIFAFISTFFILAITLANLLRVWFGVELMPFFEDAFDGLRAFVHYVMGWLLYWWLFGLLEWLWFGLTYLASLVSDVVPFRPHIVVPEGVSDLSIVSIALTRVFQNTDLIVPRHKREEAEAQMFKSDWDAIRTAEGPFLNAVHVGLENINVRYWALVHMFDMVGNAISTFLFKRRTSIGKQVGLVLAGSLMWGYVRLMGYLINVFATLRLNSTIMVIRRRILLYFAINLVGALVACGIFFVTNGYLNDAMQSGKAAAPG